MAYFPPQIATGTTTDATPNSVVTLPLASGQTMNITVGFSAFSGNNRAYTRKFAQIKNISGTLSIVGGGPTDIVTLLSDAGLGAVSATISVSGTNVLLRVTGIVLTT